MKLLTLIFSSFAFLVLAGCSSQQSSTPCCSSNATAAKKPAVSAPRTHKLHLYAK
ncbi:MAG: hypothetical protein ABIH77_00865 [Pseudomonadota bacterium]|nr:YgdI/YgdR family lipoprotein [Gammaproteobacteria bacterium]